MVNESDLLEWANLRFGDSADLALAVPGGLTAGAVDPRVESPYGTAKATAGPIQYTATTAYLQRWTVEVRIWSDDGPSNAGELQRLLDVMLVVRARTEYVLPNGQTLAVLCSLKQGGELAEDPARRRGKAVTAAAARWEVIIEGRTA